VTLNTLRQKLLALLLGLVLIGLVEGGLFLFGVGTQADQDRFVGFAGSAPLFLPSVSGAETTTFSLNPLKSNYFNPQSFTMPKPAETFRVVSLGGSTTYGRPYLGDTAFSRWLVELGNHYAGSRQYEAINAGGISYASYRAARLQDELLNYDPNLFVVYSGHNEFLEARTFAELKNESPWLAEIRAFLHHSRIYSLLTSTLRGLTKPNKQNRTLLPEEVSVELESIVGPDYYHRDEDFRLGVLEQYRHSLQRMIDQAKDKQVPLVLCTLPSNLSGISPFKSEHRSGLSNQQLTLWQQLFAQGNRAMEQGDPSAAVDIYQQALQLDDRFALLHFRYAQALLHSGQPQMAYQAFVRAKQEDIIPLRALEEINATIRELAALNTVPLADVEQVFRRVANDGIPGADLFDDHVHPNIRGQQLIAWVVFDTLVKNQMIPLPIGQWQQQNKSARQLLLNLENAVPARYHALGLWGVGRLYFWAGKYPEAHHALQQAWAELKDVPEIPFKLGTLEVFRGDGVAAIPLLKAALQLEPENLDAFVMLANAYLLVDQADKALELLDGLPEAKGGSVGYLSALGRAQLQLGELDAGLHVLEQAYQLHPEVPRSTREYAEALAINGQLPAAKEMFGRYLQQVHAPDPGAALQRWVAQKGWLSPRQWLSGEPGTQ